MALSFAKLTRDRVRKLKPGEGISEHGITATCLRNGDIRYSINIAADNQRVHRVIGRASEGVTREQAERAIEAIRTRAREGRLDLPTGRKTHPTVREASQDYLKRLEETHGKNIGIKRRHFRLHLNPELGDVRVDKITHFRLLKYRKTREDAGASIATINRELATLSHFLHSAKDWKWIKAEALPKIPKVSEPGKAIVVLSDEQCDALLRGAIGDQDQRLWLFCMFGLNAAMRHREILKVRYDRIDFKLRRIFIPEAKAGEREQPITKALADALQRQREMEPKAKRSGWVFPAIIPKQAKAGHRTNMARPFLRAVERAGLDPKKVTPHTMRHTAITNLVRAGVDLPTIQKISGHKTLSMVMRYVHVHGQHIDAGIDALNRPVPDTTSPELHNQPKAVSAEQGAQGRISRDKSAA